MELHNKKQWTNKMTENETCFLIRISVVQIFWISTTRFCGRLPEDKHGRPNQHGQNHMGKGSHMRWFGGRWSENKNLVAGGSGSDAGKVNILERLVSDPGPEPSLGTASIFAGSRAETDRRRAE